MTRIPADDALLTWARKRAGLDTLALAGVVQCNGLALQEGAHE